MAPFFYGEVNQPAGVRYPTENPVLIFRRSFFISTHISKYAKLPCKEVNMSISESTEMYLETILVLSKKGIVRSIDIANEMNFSRPTISVTVHNLEKDGFIKIAEDGSITLEEKGLQIAKTIYERHTTLSALLEKIGVPADIAAKDACKIEHDISPETFDCIKKIIKNINNKDLR